MGEDHHHHHVDHLDQNDFDVGEDEDHDDVYEFDEDHHCGV